MLNALKGLFSTAGTKPRSREPAAAEVRLPGLEPFPLAERCQRHHAYPIPDWEAVRAWTDLVPGKRRNEAWTACEQLWLLHFRDALGPEFHLDQSDSAMLVSNLPQNVARATLDFMARTLKRIGFVLDGLAQAPELGKDILIVFSDQESYYQYVSHYYPDGGEFAFSGGMYINAGCGHFVTVEADMRQIEPTIAHEMAHGCLSHLPIPAWLNEGIAVNVERRLTGAAPSLATPEQMRAKHRRFWSDATIQEFWSGHSFHRPDEAQQLSYDLARIIVEQLALDWASFREFVLHAESGDAGAAAAQRYLSRELGDMAFALLEREDSAERWAPRPADWPETAAKTRGTSKWICST